MPEIPPAPEAPLDAGDRTVIRPATPSPVTEASSGALFAGRYALGRLIGRGGMGAVYEARDQLVGDVVALKVLELGKGAGPEALERFTREVRLARRISHPHVARMHDLGTHEGQVFLTMEYVEGEDLRALLVRERVLAPPQAARIALAICEGLAAAHAAGVVHRDLKPANILVETGGRVVLTDFGIARAAAQEVGSRTLGTVGTPLYMAPEQVLGEAVDARADLYALGLVLFELLTGESAFTGDTPWAAAMSRLRQPPPDLHPRTHLPPALATLVHDCLGRSPEDRPASANVAATVLRDWLMSVGEPTLSGPVPAPTTVSRPPAETRVPAPGSLSTPRDASRVHASAENQGVALLPLRYQGPRDSEFLAESLTDALTDHLSRCRGLRVPGTGVMGPFRDARDPRPVGRELGVAWVVDGTVQCAGPAVRVSIRLLETRSGTQVWSGRFEHASADPFEVQDRLVPRITEELRGEVSLGAWRERVPSEAMALYAQAFQQLYGAMRSTSEGPLALLEASLVLAPDFVPALALHAVASVRARFMGHKGSERDATAIARDSLARAQQLAPNRVETHLARAMFAAQENEWRAAVVAARTGLDIAPFHAPTLLFLGSMQCEAGRADEGLVRLRQCYELAPSLVVALYEFARCSALRGRQEDFQWALSRLAASTHHRLAAESLGARVAAWNGDLETLRRYHASGFGEEDFFSRVSALYSATVLGAVSVEDMLARVEAHLTRTLSARFFSLICQLVTEVLCLCGQPERALDYLLRAADSALIDLEWLDRCPVLQSVRPLPGFAEGRRRVRNRIEAIWTS